MSLDPSMWHEALLLNYAEGYGRRVEESTTFLATVMTVLKIGLRTDDCVSRFMTWINPAAITAS